MKNFILLIIILIAFKYAKATDLYWIGNGGNWSDGTHWSYRQAEVVLLMAYLLKMTMYTLIVIHLVDGGQTVNY